MATINLSGSKKQNLLKDSCQRVIIEELREQNTKIRQFQSWHQLTRPIAARINLSRTDMIDRISPRLEAATVFIVDLFRTGAC